MKSGLKTKFFNDGIGDYPIYDLHGHMGSFSGIYFPLADTESMVTTLKKKGINLLVFCHHHALFSPDIGNSANIEAVRKYPEWLRAYCAINPNYPEIIAEDLKSFDEYADVYVGFKFLADYHGLPISHKNYQPAWEMADDKELLVLLHTWGGSSNDGPEQVRKVAKKYNNAKILLGHCCHGEWDKALEIAKDFPNIYLELCAVIDERGIVEKFVESIGSERIIFGTDFPWFSHNYYIGAILGADITDEDRHNIFYNNAKKLLEGVSVEV